MRNIRLVLSYDGSRYHGWQKHESVEGTIQGKIEQVLFRMSGKPVEVIGSGRTDAGVHALAQTANFYYEGEESPDQIKDCLNRYLPEDIAVRSAEEAPVRFHSRFNAVRKTYEYRVYVGTEKPVFDRKYVWTPDKLSGFDLERMKAAASYLVGEHDFLAFCGNRNFKKSSVRRIERAEAVSDGEILRLIFTGSGFLQNMVRILTGTLLEVGAGLRTPESVAEALAKRDRSLTGFMAPAKGLTLMSVEYE